MAAPGRNWVERTDGAVEMLTRDRLGRGRSRGDRFVIETPGGGGFGRTRRMIDYWPLLGILLVVVGFALRLNPMLVVTVSAIVTGLLGGMAVLKVIATFGKAFNDNRIIAIIWIVLPVIGLLERYGLQQRARTVIREMRGATVGPLLILYLLYRQVDCGDRPSVDRRACRRPCARWSRRWRSPRPKRSMASWTTDTAEKVKAMSAATDNVGLFFGEDIFIAIGSIVLIQGILADLRHQARRRSIWRCGRSRARFAPSSSSRRGCCCSIASCGGGPMITLHWLYVLAGRDVRGVRACCRASTARTASASAMPLSGG